MILILMGVSGIGKTTIDKLLSTRTARKFEDADDYHSQENRQKLAAVVGPPSEAMKFNFRCSFRPCPQNSRDGCHNQWTLTRDIFDRYNVESEQQEIAVVIES